MAFLRFRNRARPEPGIIWQPLVNHIGIVPGDEMGDEGCAGSHAYGAWFYLPGDLGVTLAIWVYVSFTAHDDVGDFCLGYRAVYDLDEGTARGPWMKSLYGQFGREFYDDFDAADKAARAAAEKLNAGPHSGASEEPAGTWDWDGALW